MRAVEDVPRRLEPGTLALRCLKGRVEMAEKIVPMTCDFEQLCALSHDNVDVGDFSIQTDSTMVWLSEQKKGHKPTQKFSINREVFNKLIRWYIEGIVPQDDGRS